MAIAFRKVIIRGLLVLVGLPVLLLLILIGTHYALFYSSPRANGRIVSSGQEREYLLHVPENYDGSEATPLVIGLHGGMVWPSTQKEISGWNSLADQHGFIVVYPSGETFGGKGTGVKPKVWLIKPDARLRRNVAFIEHLIDELTTRYTIDSSRIYVSGLSNGGAMAFALSCTIGDRIAAVGTVAAAHDQRPFDWCPDPRPVPVIRLHGRADPVVPYEGGTSWASPNPFASSAEWTASWGQRNRCAPVPERTEIASDVTLMEYKDCSGDAAVLQYVVEGAGHVWPGGGPMPEWLVGPSANQIDATRLMWEFFEKRHLE